MTALYRAYRPQVFDDVVGQEAVVRTLRNAITSDKVAHAYLFTGSKGTGKTTMAKLLAKSMNCVNGPTVDPCGVCESCVAIARGTSVDVAEIDAASNTGVQDVRDRIIDTVAFRPAMGTRRVYILDEAHMLSSNAFNALLKTIEEPPDHVLFVFCTTELHKMMPTVRDRCQRMALAPPSPENILEVLRKVAATEKITADEAALRAIARVAQGSFRNALGTLELMAAAFERSFNAADVHAHLGVFGEEILAGACGALLARDVAAALQLVEHLAQNGSDLEQFAYELAERLRIVLLAANGVDVGSELVADLPRLQAQAAGASVDGIVSAIDCIGDGVGRMRVGVDQRLALETALVRACQGLGLPALALRLAKLESGQGGVASVGQPLPPTAAPVPAMAAAKAPVAAAPPVAVEPELASPAAPEPVATPAPTPSHVPSLSGVDPSDIGAWWPTVVNAADPALKATLSQLKPIEASANAVTVSSALPGIAKQSAIEALIGQVLGTPISLKLVAAVHGDEPEPTPTSEAPEDSKGEDAVALLANAFNGTEMP
jgi:DNA polymerase-3 subunit gamma/tau